MNLPASIIIPTRQPRRFSPVLLLLGGLALAGGGVAAGLALGLQKAGPQASTTTTSEPMMVALAPSVPTTAPQPATEARAAEARAKPTPKPPTAAPATAAEAPPLATRPASICRSCGTVEGVRAVQREGEGSGLGAVAGGVVGAVVGNQMGGGNGKKAMTVIGAIGGGVAGHEIEKRSKASTVYQVRVRMDDGSLRSFTSPTAPTPGAEVRVEGESYRVVQRNADDTPRTVQTKG
jgi:outer membrane lipoprotein SlyB